MSAIDIALHDCLGKNFRLHLQTSVVEQDGGAGGFALASVREFAAWLQADAAAGAGGVISIVTSQYVPLNCFIPDFLTHLVAVFLK